MDDVLTTEASATIPEPQPAGDILSWSEVKQVHRIARRGIYQRDGRLISLLTDFGAFNPCYPDCQDSSGATITYTGQGRRGDQQLTPGNRALLAAIESKHHVPLFQKLAPGRWLHLGYWQVAAGEYRFDENENRMLWRFTLKSVMSDK